VYADHRISPFEGSPRAGAAEYVQGGMLIAKLTNRQIGKLANWQIAKSSN